MRDYPGQCVSPVHTNLPRALPKKLTPIVEPARGFLNCDPRSPCPVPRAAVLPVARLTLARIAFRCE